MDIILNQEALNAASLQLEQSHSAMNDLRQAIIASFAQLRIDWNSDAGRVFYENFERELLNNLRDHAIVLQHMSRNLTLATRRYQEVFTAAEAVANAQF